MFCVKIRCVIDSPVNSSDRTYAPLKHQDPNDTGLRKRRYIQFLSNKVAWRRNFQPILSQEPPVCFSNLIYELDSPLVATSGLLCFVMCVSACHKRMFQGVGRPAFSQLLLSCFIFVIEVSQLLLCKFNR